MLAVKTNMASAAGNFCSHIGMVSYAALAAMSQVAWWHMRTKLNIHEDVIDSHY